MHKILKWVYIIFIHPNTITWFSAWMCFSMCFAYITMKWNAFCTNPDSRRFDLHVMGSCVNGIRNEFIWFWIVLSFIPHVWKIHADAKYYLDRSFTEKNYIHIITIPKIYRSLWVMQHLNISLKIKISVNGIFPEFMTKYLQNLLVAVNQVSVEFVPDTILLDLLIFMFQLYGSVTRNNLHDQFVSMVTGYRLLLTVLLIS